MVTPIETCPNEGTIRVEAVRMLPRTHFAYIFLLTFCPGFRRRPVCLRNVCRQLADREKNPGKKPKLSILEASRRRFHVCKSFSCNWLTKPAHHQWKQKIIRWNFRKGGMDSGSIPPLHSSCLVVRVVVPIVVAVIVMRPIAVVDMPSVGVVIVVWVRPIGALIGRPLPSASPPHPTSVFGNPVSIDPYIAGAWNWWASFISIGRRRVSNRDAEGNLRTDRDRKRRSQNTSE